MQIILENTGNFAITFKYRPSLVNFIRDIPGRTFNAKQKAWIVPASSRQYIELMVQEIASFESVKWIKEQDIDKAASNLHIPDMPELTVPHELKLPPKPYQSQGIARGLELKRFINADEPGLGKTVQTIGTINIAKAFPCLVICPGSVKIHWEREWQKFTDKRAMVLSDDVLDSWPFYWNSGLYQIFIVNFESLGKYFVRHINKPKGRSLQLSHIHFNSTIDLFNSVVVDESHRCKSFTTQQSKYTKGIVDGIAKDKELKIELTGTPVINRPSDLIPQLSIIGKLDEFGGYKHFMQRYCSGVNKASNLRELNALLWQKCFFRREKKDVRKDLPAKTRQVLTCEITNRREYEFAKHDLITYLKQFKEADNGKIKSAMRGKALARMNQLSQIAARGKMKSVIEYVRDFLTSGKKIILFCTLHQVVDELKKAFPKAVCITGREDAQQKQNSIDRFGRDPKTNIVICSIKAAGTGTDGLQHQCSDIAFIEYPWTEADCDQCESRADRGGQKESVTARYFQGKNTIDEHKYKIIQRKKGIAKSVTGASDDIHEDIVDLIADMLNNEN